MKRIDSGIAATIVCMVLVVLMSIALGYVLHDRIALGKGATFDTLQEMADNVKKYFYFYEEQGESEEQLVDGALRGMMGSLEDPYAAYYTQEEYDEMLAEDAGDYRGIGISIATPNEAGSLILDVYTGSPAALAGMKKGDIITAVNGTSVAGLSMDDYVNLFFSDETSPDRITLLRGETVLTVEVMRGEVHIERVIGEMLDSETGYIRISEFSGSVVDDFWNAATSIQDKGAVNLVIDLRDNPGGGLTEVLGVAYKLVPKGQLIATIKSKTAAARIYHSEGNERIEMRLAVLINENSASASELLTGALQSHGLATVVGTQSYGKGIVQSYFRLSGNGGWMKLTTDAYYTPNDVCIQGVGITPDIVIDLPDELKTTAIEGIDHDSDTQLQAALDTFPPRTTALPAAA